MLDTPEPLIVLIRRHKPAGSTPNAGLNRKEKEEERRRELNKMREEARAKRATEAVSFCKPIGPLLYNLKCGRSVRLTCKQRKRRSPRLRRDSARESLWLRSQTCWADISRLFTTENTARNVDVKLLR